MTRPPVRGDAGWDDDAGGVGARVGRRGRGRGSGAASWDGVAWDPDAERWADDPRAGGDDLDGDLDGDLDAAPDDDRDDDRDGDRYEYEEVRPPRSRRSKVLITLLCVLALFAVVAIGGARWVHGRLDPPGDPGAPVEVAIPTGSTNSDIADLLQAEGVIVDAQAFRYYLRYKGAEGFLAGNYTFAANSAAWDVLPVLQAGPAAPEFVTFTVPEGLTVAEYPAAMTNAERGITTFDPNRIAQLIAEGSIRPATLPPEATSLEGFLFPSTYQLEEGQDEAAALRRMAEEFDAVAQRIDLVNRAAALGRTPYEIVVIASLIQEEYGIVEEMPKIARVVYNRLEVGEPLGIDATSRYEAVLAGRDRQDVDFESDSPYNTRRNPGLPPTPIAAPGEAALLAALNPVDGPWIYYVRDPDASRTPPGGHFFTDSAREFERVKAQCEEAGLGCD